MNRLSILWRTILAVVACQLLLTAGVTSLAVLYARSALRAASDSSIAGRAVSTLAAVRYTETVPPGLLFDGSLLPRSEDPRYKDIFEIRASDGHVVAQSPGADELLNSFASSSQDYADLQVDRTPYRIVALRRVPILDDEDTVQVPSRVSVLYGSSVVDIDERLKQLALNVSGASFALLLAATAFGAWMVRRGLSPLHDLAASAGTISSKNWDFRPGAEAMRTAELAPVASAIESLLIRLRESFRQQRDFTSDAAHELKTSVAILKSSLQSLLHRERTETDYRAGLYSLLEDCERLEDLLARMLRLARAEQRTESQEAQPVPITELCTTCEAAAARMTTVAHGKNVRLEVAATTDACVQAEPEDLELIWINLIENAIRYSPGGSNVTLRVTRNGGGKVRVSVEDSGPGIPEDELGRIFDRFHRADPSRARSTGGYGLGLAISKALVEAYGGRISAENRRGGGAELSVEFPVTPTHALHEPATTTVPA